MMQKHALSLAAALLLSLSVVACRHDAPVAWRDTARGRHVADRWCSECHRIAPDQPTGARPGHTLPPAMPGPDFATIAARPDWDEARLRLFFDDLHLPMPTFRLPPEERQAVIDFILSQRPSAFPPASLPVKAE